MSTFQARDNSALSRKRQIFKNSIRRQSLETFFDVKRQQLLQSFDRSQHIEDLKLKMKTEEERYCYVLNMTAQLQRQPIKNWGKMIHQLCSLLRYFNSNFAMWVQSSLIDRLGEVFHKKYNTSGLQHQVAKLLTDMISLTNPRECLSNAYILDSVIVENLIILMKTCDYPVNEKIEFMQLLGGLCVLSPTIRKRVIQIGGGEILVQFGKEILADRQLYEPFLLVYLGCCEEFLMNFTYNNKKYFPNVNFTLSLIPIILNILHLRVDGKVTKNALFCLTSILQQNLNKVYHKVLLEDPDFYEFLFQLMIEENYRIKEKVLNIFNWLAHYYFDLSMCKLWSLNLLSALNDMIQCSEPSFQRISLNFIINMIYNKETSTTLVNHELFRKIVSFIKHSDLVVRKSAYECIVQLFKILDHTEIIEIFNRFSIIAVIMWNGEIKNLMGQNMLIAENALEIIKKYIEVNVNSQTDYNKAVDDLQRKHNLDQILRNIIETCPFQMKVRAKVIELASEILDIMAECVNSDIL